MQMVNLQAHIAGYPEITDFSVVSLIFKGSIRFCNLTVNVAKETTNITKILEHLSSRRIGLLCSFS
jgi:hypothetical protein